jgi:hypothetical protein
MPVLRRTTLFPPVIPAFSAARSLNVNGLILISFLFARAGGAQARLVVNQRPQRAMVPAAF